MYSVGVVISLERGTGCLRMAQGATAVQNPIMSCLVKMV